MDWLNLFVSIGVITVIHMFAVPVWKRARRRDRFSPWVIALAYAIWVFDTIVLLGAVSNVALWVEAVSISLASATLVALTHFLLGWAWSGARADRAAQWQLSTSIAFLRLKKGNWFSVGGLLVGAGLVRFAMYLFMWFAVGRTGVAETQAQIIALTVFVWYCAVLSSMSLLSSRRVVLRSSTDEGTRTFLLTVWVTLLVPAFVGLLVMHWWERAPATIYHVWVPGGRTVAVPLVGLLVVILAAQVWVYFAGVAARRQRLRDIWVEEGDLASRIRDYLEKPKADSYASLQKVVNGALECAITYTFTPMEIVAAALRLNADRLKALADLHQELDLLELELEPESHLAQDLDRRPNIERGLELEEVRDHTTEATAMGWSEKVALPASRWRQSRWVVSWIGARLQAIEAPERLEKLTDATVRDLADAWYESGVKKDEWYQTRHWKHLVDQIERFAKPTEHLLRLWLHEISAQWHSVVAEIPRLKRPARWIFDSWSWALHRTRLGAELVLSQLVPFLDGMVRVMRRMPTQDPEWKHYTKLATAHEMLASIGDPSAPSAAVRPLIKKLESRKDLREPNPFLKLIFALLPIAASVALAVWVQLTR